MKNMTDYYSAMNEEGITGWYNPKTKHFFVPVDVCPDTEAQASDQTENGINNSTP